MTRRGEAHYIAWAEFAHQIRLWLRLSEEAARDEGISPQQHQLLLATRAFPGDMPPLIADLAERLQRRHNSVVGMIDRMEADGLVRREGVGIGRGISVLTTREGDRVLDAISRRLRPELRSTAQVLNDSLARLAAVGPSRTSASSPSGTTRSSPLEARHDWGRAARACGG